MNEVLKTKYGRAKIGKDGRYRITSGKEGNNKKLLHRLIWEDHNGPIPEGYVIHHIDENKLNNDISNLELMLWSEHNSHHMKGKPKSEETRKKISEAKRKGEVRVVKDGFNYGKQQYVLKYNRKRIKRSINKDKLLKEAEELNRW